MKVTGLFVLCILHGCFANPRPDPHEKDDHPPPPPPDPHAPDPHHPPDPHEPDPHAPDPHAPGEHHPPPDCGPDCHLIDEALHHISDHFDDHICHPFEHVHCEDHNLVHDEQICGTDGHTYMSHCEFVKARCRYILDHHIEFDLNIRYLGPCLTTTTQSSTQASSTTQPVNLNTNAPTTPTTTKLATAIIQVVVNTNAPTNSPATATSTLSTNSPTTTTNAPSATSGSQTSSHPIVSATSRLPGNVDTTTLSSTATTPSNASGDLMTILGSVFCAHKDEIDCSTSYEVTCGSDGNIYPNKCELMKAVCTNAFLISVSCGI